MRPRIYQRPGKFASDRPDFRRLPVAGAGRRFPWGLWLGGFMWGVAASVIVGIIL